MLHSMAVSNSVHSHHQSSMVLNRVYWIRGKHAETAAARNQNKASTKILGFGLFMVGVVVLAMGLILGLEFPVHIREKILRDACILDRQHNFYEKWVRDRSYVRYNRIYYWHIQNPGEFLRGKSPIFVEKGPYVYREIRRRVNVAFRQTRVSYRTMKTQTFSASHTRAECGVTCTEHDQITAINTVLLRKLHTYGSWEGYLVASVPSYINALFTNWTLNQDSNPENDSNQLLLQLLSCTAPHCANVGQATNASVRLARLLSFGAFVHQNDSIAKQTILQNINIVNSTGLLPLHFINSLYSHLSLMYKLKPSLESCQSASGNTNVSWKLELYRSNNQTLPHDLVQIYPERDDSDITVPLSNSCDIFSAVYILSEHLAMFSNWSQLQWSFSVCQRPNQPCDTIIASQDGLLALLDVTRDFIDTHLLKTVSELVLPHPETSIVHTKPQSQLATGYRRQRADADPFDADYVAGALTHHSDIAEAFRMSPEEIVGTCLEHGDTANNNRVREFNGSHFSPLGVYSRHEVPVSGYMADFPPSPMCRACANAQPSGLAHDVFLPEVYRGVRFECTGEVHNFDNTLYSYTMPEGAFSDSSLPCDQVNVTSIRGFPAVIGRPAFRRSGCEYLTRELESRTADLTSNIQVEPWTGRFWSENVRLQTSALLPRGLLEGGAAGRLYPGVTALDTPLPLHWVHRQATIAQDDINYFEYGIARMMSVSCGGLVGLVTLSLLIMVLSVFVGLLSTRKNKVHAAPEEQSTTNSRAQP